MAKVHFQNGAAAPPIVLTEEVEPGKDAKQQLDELVEKYGTVQDAAAWLHGEEKPKELADAEPEPVSAEELHAQKNPSEPDAIPAAEQETDDAPASRRSHTRTA